MRPLGRGSLTYKSTYVSFHGAGLTPEPASVKAATAEAVEAAAAEPAAGESAGSHASPAAETAGPRCPAAGAAKAIAQAAEGIRPSECAVVVAPGVGATGVEVPPLLPVPVLP